MGRKYEWRLSGQPLGSADLAAAMRALGGEPVTVDFRGVVDGGEVEVAGWATNTALSRLVAGERLLVLPDGVGGVFLVHPDATERF